jgi:predicted cytidylate kinase
MTVMIRAITISGEICSGKSSIADALIALLPGWWQVNTGQRFREYCESRGMSIQEVSHLPDEVHQKFDASQREVLETESHVVVEGRLAGWLALGLEDVFKIYCYAPLEVRLLRYMEREGVSRAKAMYYIEYRDSRDLEKFRKMYTVADYRASCFYDLQIDTSSHTPTDVALLIIDRTFGPSSSNLRK